MWPVSLASSKRLGSITVAVNRSPIRESLLESVSLIRTFRSAPAGTNGATTALLVGVRLLRVGFVCAKPTDVRPKTKATTRIACILLRERSFISFLPYRYNIRLTGLRQPPQPD